MRMRLFATVMFTGFVFASFPVLAQEAAAPAAPAADTNMEILKEKLKADKKLLVAANMSLSEPEGKKFWPLYDAYQKDLMQLNERLAKTIGAYADAYKEGQGTIKEDTAKKLLHEVLAVEKVGKVLPATKTARCIQMENKIRAVIKYELAAQIPLVY
jgi:hypothetical protein